MSNKVATNNIFASLNDDSDNEAPVKTTQPTKANTEAKPAQNASKGTHSNTRGHRERRDAGDNAEEKVKKDDSQRPKHLKDGVKSKGVPAEPHPQDRKSGTGYSGVDKKKFRKDGGGRGNYGTVKGEVQQLKEETKEVKEEVPEEVEQEPEVVDNSITFEEYFKTKGYVDEKPAQKAPERELNLDQLKREKLEVVKSKTEKVIDTNVKAANQKKNKGPTTYSLGCNTENSDLLGVKTGHTTLKYKVEKAGDELIGKVVDAKKENTTRDFKDNKEKKPFNKNKKVNVENEEDFPKLA